MLTHLTIQNIVLIKTLNLTMQTGMTVLTGETGAGKSILLDSLGLVLGERADSGLLRKGTEQANVTACFDLPPNHIIRTVLNDQGLVIEETDHIIIRRTLNGDGRSKAFLNDQPISLQLLKTIGDQLVDIHGQFQTHGLLDSKNHCQLLDNFGLLSNDVTNVKHAWKTWRAAIKAVEDQYNKLAKAKEDEDYLTACVEELQKICPDKGEEEQLLEKRQRLQHYEAVISGLTEAFQALDGDKAANESLYRAIRALEKIAPFAEDKIDPFIETLDRCLSSLRDVAGDLEMTGHQWGEDENIEHVDDRLHEIRALARKHNVMCDDLPELLISMQDQLATIYDDDKMMGQLIKARDDAEKHYLTIARDLSEKRAAAAQNLSSQAMKELPDLKLGKAIFRVHMQDAAQASQNGLDDVKFLIQTNPGATEGELGKVASGGELSRIMLALKVVLSNTSPVPVMIFDEVDSGIGGSTADAVGQRLSNMAKNSMQILAITHSPQVAAKADHHWIVAKSETDMGMMETSVTEIHEEKNRIDEIARMVSGASLTDEARAAAMVLRQAA